jgi:hypothetical protein
MWEDHFYDLQTHYLVPDISSSMLGYSTTVLLFGLEKTFELQQFRACLRGWPRVAWPALLGQAWIGRAQMVQSTLFACMFPQSRVESRLCLRPFWELG